MRPIKESRALSDSTEWIDDPDARLLEIPDVSCGEGQAVLQGGGGYHPIEQRHHLPTPFQSDHQLRPAPAHCGIPRQTLDRLHHRLEPALKPRALATRGKREHSQEELAENDRVDYELALVPRQPLDDFGVGTGLRRLAQNIRIDEEGHQSFGISMSSVVSVRSIGRNQPLTGQASRSSTNPSLRERAFRFSRYSPRSMRSISKCWPGLMSSRLRISAGRTIWPLLETVVSMQSKILSYHAMVNLRPPDSLKPSPAECIQHQPGEQDQP